MRDVPDDAFEVIVERAKANGQSLQQYMRMTIIDFASRPTKVDFAAAVEDNLRRLAYRREMVDTAALTALGLTEGVIDVRHEIHGALSSFAWSLRQRVSFYDALYVCRARRRA